MRALALAAAFAFALTVSGCGGDARTYSVEETESAFSNQGFELEVPPELADQVPADSEGAVLARPGDDRFFLVVTTDEEVDDVWPDYERLADDDSFTVRRANVALFADDGLPESDRLKVLAALESLPDRGDEVLIAER